MKQCLQRGLLAICIFILGFLGSAEAQAEEKVIKVGYFDYSGFIEEEKDGKFKGYGAEYLDELSHYTGWSYEYVYGSWSQCLAWLKDGEIDLLCTAQRTKEREEVYDYCEYSSGLEYTVLYANPENDSIYFEDYENLNGKKVGMMKNSYQNAEFAEFQKLHNLTMETIYFDTNMEMEDALRVGMVDVIVSGSLDASPEFKLIAKVGLTPFYFITKKGNTALMDELNSAMRQIQMERPFFNGYLHEKYYGKPVNTMIGQERAEAEYLKKKPELIVSFARNNYPMGYLDEKTREASGYYVELVRKIAADTGISVKFVPAFSGTAAIQMVQRGEADLTVAVYGNEALKERYDIDYTTPYTTAEIAVIARRGSGVEDKNDIVAAVPRGFASYNVYLEEWHPDWKIENYDSVEHCMEAVALGKADVALADSLYLQAYAGINSWKELVVVSGMECEVPMSLGIGKDQPPELKEILRKSFLKLTGNDLKQARIKCMINQKPPFDFSQWLRRNIVFIACFIGICGLSVFFVLHKKELYYRRLAMTDELTGVWNRNKFIKEAERILNRNKQKSYYLISTDIDKFKYINDTFGYSTGDELLKEEARQFSKIFGENGCFARIAADEFVGLAECSETDSKEEELSRKLDTFENNMRNYSNQYFRIQIKMGLYKIEKRENDIRITECIDRANIAKKRIKGNLNQTIAYFDSETARRSALENEIEGKMEKALENKEFCVYYQPKYNLVTEEIEGAEALVRWIDPDRGMIGPDVFIPLFEKNGFIIRLDFFVYEEVCRHLKKWISEGRKVVPVSVNVSRAHLGTPNFIPDLAALLKKYEIPVELIELELTESVFSKNEQAVKRMVVLLKNMGFHISIDDFGSGYSSLNLLRQIPADVLKIDRGFLGEVEASVKSRIIVSQVVSMARKLNIHTVCEGVETKKQADFLREIRCEIAQGFLFSKPVPMEEFEGKITLQS